jgi:integrase
MRQINPINHKGSIQLKFSVNKKRYSFNPIPGADFSNKRDLASVQAIATQIHNDILANCFDSTLNKYKVKASASPRAGIHYNTAAQPVEAIETIELWDRWVESLQLSERTKAGDYRSLRSHLEKTRPKSDDIGWLLKPELSPSTFNKYLGYLKRCYTWGIQQNLLLENIYADIKSRKSQTKDIKPFSHQEIMDILAGFDELYPCYSSFVRFLFATGVRTSEAIGLQWKDVDLVRKTVTISESLPVDKTGNGYKKIRKATKTGSSREIQMNTTLQKLLTDIFSAYTDDKKHQLSQNDLVFLSPAKCIIDLNNFRERYWKRVLKVKNINYRYPYVCRHTLLSHALEAGVPITGVAYIAGHKDTTMIIKHYGKLLNKPNLPDMF